jgi:cytochrome c-type biogenesis protein CcmF
VLISAVVLLLLAAVTLVGTLIPLLSKLILGRGIVVGIAFYNRVFIPTGLLLLAATAAAPLLRWGSPPRPAQKTALLLSGGVGGLVAVLAWVVGLRQPILLAVLCLAASAAAGATVGFRIWDLGFRISAFGRRVRDRTHAIRRTRPVSAIRRAKPPRGCKHPPYSAAPSPQPRAPSPRKYAGYLIHLGIVCLAVGVAGSSLGARRQEVVMSEGQTIEWAGRSIRCTRLIERELPDKLVTEAQLEVSRHGAGAATLLPARHLHRLQNEWTTEVAIHSTWRGDFYAILHGEQEAGRASLTFIENPMIRWMWCGGWIAGMGAVVGLWPARRRPPRHSAALLPARMMRSTLPQPDGVA